MSNSHLVQALKSDSHLVRLSSSLQGKLGKGQFPTVWGLSSTELPGWAELGLSQSPQAKAGLWQESWGRRAVACWRVGWEAVPRASADFSALATDLSKVFQSSVSKVFSGLAGVVSGIRLVWRLE